MFNHIFCLEDCLVFDSYVVKDFSFLLGDRKTEEIIVVETHDDRVDESLNLLKVNPTDGDNYESALNMSTVIKSIILTS